MTPQSYDVVIVGARWPVQRSRRFSPGPARRSFSWTGIDCPSDRFYQLLPIQIHPPGIDVLDEVGVGDAVRAVAPATHVMRLP